MNFDIFKSIRLCLAGIYFLQLGVIPRGSASVIVPSWRIKNTPTLWVGWDFYFLLDAKKDLKKGYFHGE